MQFMDDVHKEFYTREMHSLPQDPYFRSLIYLLALTRTTRTHFNEMFDSKSGIKPDCLTSPWQTGTSMRLTRLAFNLFNGHPEDNIGDTKGYTPWEIFDCELQRYFFEAIRLRYPDFI